ncbi:MAG: Ig-like domain-containing protein [Bacteroidales bacterium]|nr:Ig-like domain-containing protein [Bacteroidales bacterium]
MFRIIAPIAIIALAASCSREIQSDSVSDVFRRYNISIDESTKTELSGTGSKRQVNWSAGDEIKYYTKTGQSSAASAGVTIDGSSAWVEIPRGRNDELINAVYGASQLKSGTSTESVMYVSSPVKNEQSYTSFAQAHLCAAFSDDIDNPELKFHNAAAVLKFTPTAAIHKVVFHGNNNEIITGGSNGDLKISYSGGALATEAASTGGTSITVQTNGADKDFYIAVLPVTFAKGITVDGYDADNYLIFTKKAGGTINTVSGSGAVKVLNLGSAQDWLASAPPTAVDLGLSVKWASFNVGATCPEGNGDYFAWGETAPKGEYKWANYQFSSSKNGPFSKYVLDASYGAVDHKSVLDLADDTAHAAWGDDWRMPTKEEVAELMNTSNCTWTWTTKNGVPGYKVTSRKSGFTGNSIFLPANGMMSGVSPVDEGTAGNYWTSSISADYPYYAISPFFDSSNRNSDNCYRYFGLGIRPVQGAVVPVSSITMPETLPLIIGASGTLSATVLPANATYKNLTWTSSDESIATVNAYGKVTSIAIGTATITAYSADGGITATCMVSSNQFAESLTLNETSIEMYVGDEPFTLTATILPENNTLKSVSWSSSKTSVATVDQEGRVTAVADGTATITAKTKDGSGLEATCLVIVKLQINGHECVDLGLSVKWATCNVGAFAPEEYGDYYAWGETQPRSVGYDNWSTYKWCNGTNNKLTKYCTDSSCWDSTEPMDYKTVIDPEDDAAHTNWGGSWRMPTEAEWTELMNNCTRTWMKQNGINGILVTGSNGNSIFLPAACSPSSWYNDDSHGYFWSSSLVSRYPRYAYYFDLSSGNGGCIVGRSAFGRCCVFSVRPVSE